MRHCRAPASRWTCTFRLPPRHRLSRFFLASFCFFLYSECFDCSLAARLLFVLPILRSSFASAALLVAVGLFGRVSPTLLVGGFLLALSGALALRPPLAPRSLCLLVCSLWNVTLFIVLTGRVPRSPSGLSPPPLAQSVQGHRTGYGFCLAVLMMLCCPVVCGCGGGVNSSTTRERVDPNPSPRAAAEGRSARAERVQQCCAWSDGDMCNMDVGCGVLALGRDSSACPNNYC